MLLNGCVGRTCVCAYADACTCTSPVQVVVIVYAHMLTYLCIMHVFVCARDRVSGDWR